MDGNWNIYVIRSRGGKPVCLTFDTHNDILPIWSRDGNWIYFSSNRTGRIEVWKVPAGGGNAVQVTRNGGLYGVESPDG